jgi:hypothetical protein
VVDPDLERSRKLDDHLHPSTPGSSTKFTLAISPVMFDGGPRLFAGIGRDVGVDLVETIASPRVTHARYAVHKP